jgi:hypothetical protein
VPQARRRGPPPRGPAARGGSTCSRNDTTRGKTKDRPSPGPWRRGPRGTVPPHGDATPRRREEPVADPRCPGRTERARSSPAPPTGGAPPGRVPAGEAWTTDSWSYDGPRRPSAQPLGPRHDLHRPTLGARAERRAPSDPVEYRPRGQPWRRRMPSEARYATVQRLLEQLNGVILGKSGVIRDLVVAILAGGHVLLEDRPGVGKTTLAKALSRSLSVRLRRRTSWALPSTTRRTGASRSRKDRSSPTSSWPTRSTAPPHALSRRCWRR